MEIASKLSFNINLLSFSVKCLDLHVKKVFVYLHANRTRSTYMSWIYVSVWSKSD